MGVRQLTRLATALQRAAAISTPDIDRRRAASSDADGHLVGEVSWKYRVVDGKSLVIDDVYAY